MWTTCLCLARHESRRSAGTLALVAFSVLLSSRASNAFAQSFELWQNLPGLGLGDAQWGDFDGDGDLDLVICGGTGGWSDPDDFCATRTYENQNGTLAPHQELIGVRSQSSGNLAWGDYDGDGDLDLAIAGYTGERDSDRIGRIYQNDGSGSLTWDTEQVLTGVSLPGVAWGDYDNDGDLDLVIAGHDGTQEVATLYLNDPPGTLTPDPTVSLTGVRAGSADWADYDGDGDLDLLLTGTDGSSPRTIFYRNEPVGTLTDTGSHGLPGAGLSDTAWGDFDNDGDLDLAWTGSTANGGPNYARFYQIDGSGNFTQVAQPLNIYRSSCAWGDYDNDGDLDVAFCGYTSVSIHTRIYRNTGYGFEAAFDLEPVAQGSLSWADVDRDGDLDFFLMGTYWGWWERTQLHCNLGGTPNTAPAAPTELTCDSAGGGLHLSWSGASDAETPTAGLYYCLRVGTSPGAHDVMSGCYGTPLMGNVYQATDWVVNVPSGTYYWSVRTIDSGFMASPWSEEMVCEYDHCEGDIDGDGDTDHSDLGALPSAWCAHEGDPNWNPNADLDGDGHVGHGDLGILLGDWECGTGL